MSPDRQCILQGTQLRDVLLRTFDPSLQPQPHSLSTLQAPDEVEYVAHDVLEHGDRMQGGARATGAFGGDMRIQSWARRYAEADPIVIDGDPVLEGLNVTQRRAMATMVGQRISLVQGVRVCISPAFPARDFMFSCPIAPGNRENKDHHRDDQIAQGTKDPEERREPLTHHSI